MVKRENVWWIGESARVRVCVQEKRNVAKRGGKEEREERIKRGLSRAEVIAR